MTIDGLSHGIDASKRAVYYRKAIELVGAKNRYESISVVSPYPWTVLCPNGHKCFIVHCYHIGGYDAYAVCPVCKEWGVNL